MHLHIYDYHKHLHHKIHFQKHHIQQIEDVDRAHALGGMGHGGPSTAEEFLEEREGLHIKTLGGW